MSAMALSQYAEIGLLLFIAAFAAVVWQLALSGRERPGRGGASQSPNPWQRLKQMPLENDEGPQ